MIAVGKSRLINPQQIMTARRDEDGNVCLRFADGQHSESFSGDNAAELWAALAPPRKSVQVFDEATGVTAEHIYAPTGLTGLEGHTPGGLDGDANPTTGRPLAKPGEVRDLSGGTIIPPVSEAPASAIDPTPAVPAAA